MSQTNTNKHKFSRRNFLKNVGLGVGVLGLGGCMDNGNNPILSKGGKTMPDDIPSVAQAYRDYFDIGAAVSPESIISHEKLLKKHFNSITAENCMKMGAVHPAGETWDFDAADRLVKFAQQNRMKIRGHTLIWHKLSPDWIFQDQNSVNVSAEVLLGRMKDHITAVLDHFRGEIYCWDVVNEAVADEGDELLRISPWSDIIGPEYIAKAFQFAHAVDPEVLLFYNDYNATIPHKRDKILRLLKQLKDQGAPIHGLGLQGHWTIHHPSRDEIRRALDLYSQLDLQIQITELDLSVFRHGDHRQDLKSPTEQMLRLQEEYYVDIFEIFRQYKGLITSVTLWGVADNHTWLDNNPVKNRKDWPLLFDAHHQPKKFLPRLVDFTD